MRLSAGMYVRLHTVERWMTLGVPAYLSRLWLGFWVAVKELKLGHQNPNTIFCHIIYPYYGKLNEIL